MINSGKESLNPISFKSVNSLKSNSCFIKWNIFNPSMFCVSQLHTFVVPLYLVLISWLLLKYHRSILTHSGLVCKKISFSIWTVTWILSGVHSHGLDDFQEVILKGFHRKVANAFNHVLFLTRVQPSCFSTGTIAALLPGNNRGSVG